MTIETNNLDATLEALGYSLTVKLVRDDFDGREGSHTFVVTLVRNGQSFETKYTAGCAHRHYPNREIMNDWQDAPKSYKKGTPIEFSLSGRSTIAELEQRRRTVPSAPTLADVVSCIVSDAQAVADGQSFEDFAADTGCDEDSRKAEKAYNGCRDSYFALIRLGADLEDLSKLFVDY